MALVADHANAAVNELQASASWSDWHLAGDEEFQSLRERVEELEAGAGSGPAESSEHLQDARARLDNIADRVRTSSRRRNWRGSSRKPHP